MKKYIIWAVVIIVLAVLFIVGYKNKKSDTTQDIASNANTEYTAEPVVQEENINNTNTNTTMNDDKKIMNATLHTTMGDIKIEFSEENAPNTVANFKKLASSGFYTGIKFHRVIKGFMIQAGDPLTKDDTKMDFWGTGGPGYKFADELHGDEKYMQGTVAMANAGPNTNGSQFFIVTASPSVALPPSYTVFGKVVSGMDVALKIENTPTSSGDKPVTAVVINSITLE